MKKLVLALLAAASLTAGAAQAADRIEVGRLSCDVDGGIGFVIGSSKDVECTFHRKGHRDQVYTGSIDKLGFDVGITAGARIEWIVFSAATTEIGPRSLAGTYVGASSEATLGVGLGANWLVGGSRQGFALQPWSVQAQAGANLSLTWSRLRLH
jgi:hypothetical protein